MPHEKLRPSFVFDEERLNNLKQIAPEAFADGRINWDVLKQALGEQLEEEGTEAEHFGLFWPGKREARKIASIPSKGTLIPVKGEGIDEDKTKNIFIEGENLEVLKLLQKSYAGKIKMIYIDPPYNTGNDFVYDDNFTEPLEEYLKYTGQMDEEGKLLTTNKRADGRFHSKWLNMMYPRLRLARNLLRDDGVIFISIDDNELHHLHMLINDIFGEENFVSNMVWKKKTGAGSSISHVFNEHEYVLAFSKNSLEMASWRIKSEEDGNFRNPDSDERGPWESCALTAPSSNLNPNQLFLIEVHFHNDNFVAKDVVDGRKKLSSFNYLGHTIVLRETREDDPVSWEEYDEKKQIALFIRRWAFTKKSIENVFKERKVFLNGKNLPRFKKFEKDYQGKAMRSIYFDEFSTQQGTEEVRKLLGEGIFDFPKPVGLIKHLVKAVCSYDDIVLDFFAGSCTAAHAVLRQNYEDQINRRFIMVQFPELTDPESRAYKAGFKTIADIGKKRIQSVIDKEKIKASFKVFRLDKSNFKQWQDYKGKDPKELASLFKEHETPLIDGWKPENLLIEVMLQEGFPLDSEIAELKDYKKNAIIQVKSEFCEHRLLVCFDKKIYQETIDTLDIKGEDIFVCLDSALSDEQKITLSDKGFLKTI